MPDARTADSSLPSVLVPYPGPDGSGRTQDIFVYLRPETNGVLAESTVFRVVERCSEYKSSLFLTYLANIPGDFMVRNHVVEEHYALKLYFAVHGRAAFTTRMREQFEEYFRVAWDAAPVIGAFEAIRELNMRPDELFETWVSGEEVLLLSGQNVKRIRDRYVVNYDVPALLHKNNRNTDVAVMVFRTSVDYDYFGQLLGQMREGLVEAGAMNPRYHLSRAMHHSKSPFEQVLDGMGYLYQSDGSRVPFEKLSFVAYCAAHGVTPDHLRGVLSHPLGRFQREDGSIVEDEIVNYTFHENFEQSLQKLRRMVSQYLVPR